MFPSILRNVYFNSRPSARGDVSLQPSGKLHLNYFNSRPSARGDKIARGNVLAYQISIHAPPRGATKVNLMANNPPLFQFTPLREGRPRPLSSRGFINIYFNSRPSARGDGKRYAISANLLFNPYKSAWLNNSATQFVEIILVIFHRIIA